MFSKFVTWIKREGSSLEVAFHNAVNSIHAELARLEGIAVTARKVVADVQERL